MEPTATGSAGSSAGSLREGRDSVTLEQVPDRASQRGQLDPPGPLCDWVAEVIVGRIGDGYYEPGQRLVETELGTDLGVSRAPIRDALRILERDGLVTISPRRGASVAEFTEKMVDEIYECRIWLAGLAVKLAVPKLDARDVAYLRSVLQEMEAALASGQVRDYFQPKRQFHNYLYERSGNSVLQDLHNALTRRVARLRQVSLSLPERAESSLESHRELVQAIENGDGDRAAEILAGAIARSREALRNYLRTRSAPSEPT